MDAKTKENIYILRCEGKSYEYISNQLGIKKNTIKSFCKRAGIKGVYEKPLDVIRCKNCNVIVSQNAKRKEKAFCCDKCRMQWWNNHRELVQHTIVNDVTCACCGKSFKSYGNRPRKYCSQFCYFHDRFGEEVRYANEQ